MDFKCCKIGDGLAENFTELRSLTGSGSLLLRFQSAHGNYLGVAVDILNSDRKRSQSFMRGISVE